VAHNSTRWFFVRKSPSYASLTVLDLQDAVLAQIKIGNLCTFTGIKVIDGLAKEAFALYRLASTGVRNRANRAQA